MRRWWTLPLRSPLAAAAAAGVVALLVHARSLENGFAFDDVHIVAGNPAIQDLSRLPETLRRPYWPVEMGRELGIWRPLTTSVLAVEWALWGSEPMPYHAVNVAAHGGATALATLVLAHLLPLAAALFGGLVFAVHPVHVEAVANVVGVSEMLAAILVLAACLAYLRGTDGGTHGRRSGNSDRTIARTTDERTGGRPRPGLVILVAALYALAVLAKESAVVLPGLLVLLDAWKRRLTVRDLPAYLGRRVWLFASLGAVAGVLLWLRVQILGSVASPLPPLGGHLLEEAPRIWSLPVVWLNYLRLMIFPVNLVPDYAPGVIDIQLGWNALNIPGVLLTLGVLALAWAVWRSPEARTLTPLTLGVLWFGVAVLPVANVFFLSGVLLAERTLYLPSLGVAIAAGGLLAHAAARSRHLTMAVVTVALLLMVARTWTAAPVWRSTATVADHLLETHPESGRAQWMLAERLIEEDGEWSRGLAVYRMAVVANGTSYPFMADLVDRLLELGANESAAVLAERMWRDHPSFPRGPARLTVALARLGRDAGVVEAGTAALEHEPDNAILHHLVAEAHRRRGAWDRALVHRRAAIASGEGHQWLQWSWLADLQIRTADTARALASLDSAHSRTDDPAARAALDSLEAAWRPGGL